MAGQIIQSIDSQSNIVVHDWPGEPSNTVEVGHTENVFTEDVKSRRPVWTRETTHWLMEEMKLFEMREEKHQIKKRAMYEELAEKFTEANFTIDWEAIQKKWQNLMSTYWRNLKKPKKAGQWEYFGEMDIILRRTSVWVGLNGCKDPTQAQSLYYTDQLEDRMWSTERILFLLEEMKQLEKGDDLKGRRNIFHRIALSFQELGVDIDWKSIQKKWHNLMSTYKRNMRKPRDEVVWEYYDAMDGVVGKVSTCYRRMGLPDSSVFASSVGQDTAAAAQEDNPEDRVWNHDNTLFLMEEMFVVKDRKGKHLLKNRVVFREIADAFNTDVGVKLDWKQVLKKWQNMYIIYSKIMRRVMQPMQWQYFERMHDIVGDTDMYVGIGSKKSDSGATNSDAGQSDETFYHYINPEDNSQFVLSSREVNGNNIIETKEFSGNNDKNSSSSNNNNSQYFEYHPETGTYRSVSANDGDGGSFVAAAAEYVVHDGIVVKAEEEMGNDGGDDDDIGTFARQKFDEDLAGSLAVAGIRDDDVATADDDDDSSYSFNFVGKGTDLSAEMEKVLTSGLVFDGDLLEKGVVFEEHVETVGSDQQQQIIEVDMEMDDDDDDRSVGSDREINDIEMIECDEAIESIVDDATMICSMTDEAQLEISEADFDGTSATLVVTSPRLKTGSKRDSNTCMLVFDKENGRKRKVIKTN